MKVEKTANVNRQTKLIINERVIPTFKKSSINKTFLAESKNKIIGLVIVEIKNKRVLSIAYIVVDSKYQKIGIGSALIKAALGYAKKLKMERLEVLVAKLNKRAQEFYKDKGFSLWYYLLGKELKK